MLDEVNERVGKRRSEELRSDYWKAMVDRGAHVSFCTDVDQAPKSLVRDIIGKGPEGRRWVIVEAQLEIKETEAGQELYSQLGGMVEKQTKILLLQRIEEAKKGAEDHKVVLNLEKELRKLASEDA